MIVPAFHKTRIAPTPSGYLHLGNILSFSLTAALRDSSGARLLLRIDDMDRDRVKQEYVQDIFDTLDFMGIPWDEGPRNYYEFKKKYSQLHRMDLYSEALMQLKNEGNLFACLCSRSQVTENYHQKGYPGTCRNKHISPETPGVNWRVYTSPGQDITIRNISGQYSSYGLPASMKDFIVRKKDGFPAYQLSSLIDDIYFGIDMIVRGEDLLPSTLAQQYLAGLLGKEPFRHAGFYHHPLLMENEHSKLSKSAGAVSIQYLRKQGKTPASIYSRIAAMAGIDMKEEIKDYKMLANAITDFSST